MFADKEATAVTLKIRVAVVAFFFVFTDRRFIKRSE